MKHEPGLKGLLVGVLTVGLAPMLGGFARDMGKRRETELWRSWGGGPTTRFLRHRDSTIGEQTKVRYFRFLASAAGIIRPTPAEEAADPTSADATYESAGAWLRRYVRATCPNPLANEKLAAYGFARNLLGLKPIGLSLTLSMAALVGFLAIRDLGRGGANFEPLVIALAVNLAMAALWTFWVAPDRVQMAAEAYAKALLESCESAPPAQRDGTGPSSTTPTQHDKATDMPSLATGKA